MSATIERTNVSDRLGSFLISKVVYPLWTKRDHPDYRRYARTFEKSQHLSASALEELQTTLLRRQLIHAYRNVPFYRRSMETAGITPFEIRSLSDLQMLPVLTKREIQDNKGALLADNVPESRRVKNQTGGSTGSPLQFWVDKERFDSRRASTDRHNAWAGLRPGDWCAQLWGSRLDTGGSTLPKVTWRQQLLYRTLTLNTSLVSETDLNAYIELLRRYRPRHLITYAQAGAMFAQYCRKVGADDIRFDSMITTAEVLSPQDRSLMEETFRGKVFNRYGCRELSVIASECEHHSGLHVNADVLLVEIEPLPGMPAGLGRVLVTDLLNRSMPLIRYEIGDLASWETAGPCACGRSLPRLARIEGRTTDFLRLPDGRMVSGPSLTLVVGDMSEIRQAQFLQPRPNQVRLKVVSGDGYSAETAKELERRLHSYFRDQVELSIQVVDDIPKEPSGKYRFVKTEFEEPTFIAPVGA
jgi:phenylacetate-CoA ligase